MTVAESKTLPAEAVELESRTSHGMKVRLIWVPERGEVFVEQVKDEAVVLRQVPKGEALTVFNHPETFDEIKLTYDYRVTAGSLN